MAQAKLIPLFKATTGLNNALDPVRLSYDLKTGVTELAQLVNMNVDNSGRPFSRLGRSTAKRAEASRCAFSTGETCLFVAGTELYRLLPDYSRAIIRTGLTLGARMRYYQIAGRIYYTNGYEKGYVSKGVDFAWQKGTFTAPGNPKNIYSNPPTGHLVSWFAGRALMAKDDVVFASLPSFYGVFDLHSDMKLFPNRVTMLQPTPAGLWVGTTTQVLFYRGAEWRKTKREEKAPFGVIEGSAVWCPAEKMGGPKSVIFTTPQGICSGSEDGTFTNHTYNKLIFPAGRYASAAIVDSRYLVLIEA